MKKKYKIGLWALSIIAGVLVLSALLLGSGIMILMNKAENTPLREQMADEARLVQPIVRYHSQHEVSPSVYRLYLLAADLPAMHKEALEYYQIAAFLGYAPAQNALGEYYQFGPLPDMKKAVRKYRQAAEQGYAPAQGRLALCYLLGEGTEANAAEAEKWIEAAEKQDCADAQLARGASLLLTGDAEKRSEAEVKLFEAITQYYDKKLFLKLFTHIDEPTVKALQEGAAKGQPADEAALGIICALRMNGAPTMDAKATIALLTRSTRPTDNDARTRAELPGISNCSKEHAAALLAPTGKEEAPATPKSK